MRKEVIGNCTLYQGDCFDVLSDISGVDCVVTDPPYGLTANSWDKAPDLAIFWKHLHEAAKLDAAFCVFCQMPFAADLYQANRKNFRYEYIYIKPKPVGWLNANRLPMRKHENIYIFYRSFPTYLPQKTSGTPYKKTRGGASSNYHCEREKGTKNHDGARYPTSVLDMEFEKEFYTSCFYTRHPTQKSVNVLLFLIRTYSEEGNVVLDPFMGNGSTGVAAVKCGRRFIGIEKEQKYFDAALRRIERTYEDRALLEIA